MDCNNGLVGRGLNDTDRRSGCRLSGRLGNERVWDLVNVRVVLLQMHAVRTGIRHIRKESGG